jgi:LuxR family maltose regulon positive regulatory protein
MAGRLHNNIEEILQAAETALQNTASPESPESTEPDEKTNDLLGQIAANRAMLAVPKNQVDTIITQAQRALRYLHPANIPMRTTTNWTLGYAYQLQGNRVAASQAYATTIAHSQKSGNLITEIAATTSLGQIQEAENQAQQAEASFQRILKLVGEPPWPAACEACVGLGRLHYQWNKLETAERYAQQGLNLAQQLENIDTPAACYVLLARIKLAQNDSPGALAALIEADNFVQAHQFSHWTSQIAAQRIEILVHQSQLAAAAELAQLHNLPLSQARIQLAQNKPDTALATLKAAQKQADAKNWADKQLDILRWQALAQQAMHTPEQALHTLGQALALAEPSGLLRPFVDAGPAMARLLQAAIKRNVSPTFARQVLRAFPQTAPTIPHQTLPDALSERELEVLQLLATELSGPEIAHQLMISLNTLRTHTKNIYSKLGVNRRQQAVRQAEELKLL